MVGGGDGRQQAALSLFFAIVGYVSTALHTLRAQQHRGRVDRVSEQLKELYGPLLACVTASKSSYDAMLQEAGALARSGGAMDGQTPSSSPRTATILTPAELREAIRSDPSGPIASCYRTWVRQVLLPLSERASRLVVERADLLEGSSIEPLLLRLVAHVSALKVLVYRWDSLEQMQHGWDGSLLDSHERELQSSQIAYPDSLRAWVEAGFAKLKQRQAELLGIAEDGSQGSPLMQIIASRL